MSTPATRLTFGEGSPILNIPQDMAASHDGLAMLLDPMRQLRPLAEPAPVLSRLRGHPFIVQQMLAAKDEAAQAACCRYILRNRLLG